MRLFGFRGGVHPEALKQHTAEKPIAQLPLPKRLYIPLQQHVGDPAEPEVVLGQQVLKGELLARSQGVISAPVHAPSSGTVIGIEDFAAPHPSGLPVRTIMIETDGKERWSNHLPNPGDPFDLEPDTIIDRIGHAGIVGMGGAAFPSAVKLSQRQQYPIHTLIINGSECEPYLTCDERLMLERATQLIDGVRLIRHALQSEQAVVAIEDSKPKAYGAMRAAAKGKPDVKVIKIPSRYPMGWDKQLIRIITGQEVPPGARSASIGVCVHNVGTVYAVYQALRFGHPLVSRIVTVAGGAVQNPQNLEVPIGARVSDLLDYCGGLTEPPGRLLMGGPMMGQVMPHTQVPIVKRSSGILALTQHEIDDGPERPCIRCSRCVQACPVGLMPLEMASRIRADDLAGTDAQGVRDCISCGCCSYVCPSKIPLVQLFNYANGGLETRREAELKAEQTKRMAQARIERLAQQEAMKRARKANKTSKKASLVANHPQTSKRPDSTQQEQEQEKEKEKGLSATHTKKHELPRPRPESINTKEEGIS